MEGIEMLREWVGNVFVDTSDQHRELYEISEAIEDEVAGRYMPLPTDADGEAVHVGDVMEWPDGEAFEVVAIGGGTLYYVDEGEVGWTGVEGKRHHVRQAVVDVLREFGDWYAHTKGGCDEDGVLAEYAAKLRLAEEG